MRINTLMVSVISGILLSFANAAGAQVPGIPCAPEPTDQFIGYGTIIDCEISPIGDMDLFHLEGTAGDAVLIQLVGPGGFEQPCVDLIDPDGVHRLLDTPAQRCAFPTKSVNLTLDKSGTWTMRIYETDNNQVVQYSLELQCLGETCGSGVVCDVQLSQMTYNNGDTVAISVLRFANNRPVQTATEIKLWLSLPGLGQFTILNVGSDGSVALPPGFDLNLGPAPLFQVTPALPAGMYELGCRILDPVTGRVLDADVNPFVVRSAAVRILYVIPQDRAYRSDYAAAVQSAMGDLQSWYGGQLSGKTFSLFSTQVEICRLPQVAAYYSSVLVEGARRRPDLCARLVRRDEHRMGAVCRRDPRLQCSWATGRRHTRRDDDATPGHGWPDWSALFR